MENFNNRARSGAVRYLMTKGYEVHEPDRDGWIVCSDPEGVLVFAQLACCEGEMEPESPDTAAFERAALGYLMENAGDVDDITGIRYDTITVCAMTGGKALLRHHIACQNPR